MSTTLSFVLSCIVGVATMVATIEWLVRNVLEVPSKRPLRSAVAVVVLTTLTVSPAVFGFDVLLAGSVSSFTRFAFAFMVGTLQTGLVLRLVYRTSLPLAAAHGVVLQLACGAMSLLLMLLEKYLGGLYAAAPLAVFVTMAVVKRVQDRQLTRLYDSIPPTAPFPGADTLQA